MGEKTAVAILPKSTNSGEFPVREEAGGSGEGAAATGVSKMIFQAFKLSLPAPHPCQYSCQNTLCVISQEEINIHN